MAYDGRSEKMLHRIFSECDFVVVTFSNDGKVHYIPYDRLEPKVKTDYENIVHQNQTPLIDVEHIIKKSGLHKTIN